VAGGCPGRLFELGEAARPRPASRPAPGAAASGIGGK
jgi:hypothetical protein